MKETPDPKPGACIVLAEPSRTRAMIVAHGLESAGWTVSSAHSADEAFDLACTGAQALIAADHPGADTGVALCRRLRAHPVTAAMPVLILSGSEDDVAELASFEAGADDHLRATQREALLPGRIGALLRRGAQGRSQTPTARPHALIVDDSVTYREFVAMKLERAGCEVTQVDSAGAGLKAMAARPYSVVMLDMNLPDMHGPVMCARFASVRDGLDRPPWIFMLTGGESLDEMNAVLKSGADEVVGKSRDFRIIEARLNALLRRAPA